jgi:hypothetical protein
VANKVEIVTRTLARKLVLEPAYDLDLARRGHESRPARGSVTMADG